MDQENVKSPEKRAAYGLWMPALVSLVLIFPLIELPRPSLITAPPWKVELLASVGLLAAIIFGGRRSGGSVSSLSPRLRDVIRLLLLFTAWSGLSMIWSDVYGPVVHHTFVWAVYLAFLFVLLAVLRERGTRLVYDSAVMLSILIGLLCLIDYASIVDFAASEGTLRIRWAKYAELLITISPFLWALLLFKGRMRDPLVWAAAALSWITAMLSLSKAAFISGAIGFAIFFLAAFLGMRRRYRRPLAIVFCVWLLLTIGTQAAFTWFSSVPSTVQYISGSADQTRTTSSMRVFTWKVAGDMISSAWATGVGAGNFGKAFNEGRARYAERNPGDKDTSIGEDYIFERAHNEYVQIAAELGIPGSILAVGAFVLFGVLLLRVFVRYRGRVSPILISASAGMAAFAVSSMFTSFSFRAMQNGLAFFAMMAVAAHQLARVEKPRDRRSPGNNKWVFAFSIVSAAGLAVLSGAIAVSNALIVAAESRPSISDSEPLFASALRYYPDNAGGHYAYAVALARAERFDKAADRFERAARLGAGANVTYSSLSLARASAGDLASSEQALRGGIRIYPRSLFLRARLVIFLEEQQRHAEAGKELAAAREIDQRQASGWYALIRFGSSEAYQRSKADPQIAAPAELVPANAIYPYLDESFGPGKATE